MQQLLRWLAISVLFFACLFLLTAHFGSSAIPQSGNVTLLRGRGRDSIAAIHAISRDRILLQHSTRSTTLETHPRLLMVLDQQQMVISGSDEGTDNSSMHTRRAFQQQVARDALEAEAGSAIRLGPHVLIAGEVRQ